MSGWLYQPLPSAAAPQAFTLTAEAGSYAVAGQAATLLRSCRLTAEAGSYNVTGSAATLTYSAVVTPPSVDVGGDRGVILFREPAPKPKPIPEPADFSVTFYQTGQQFYAKAKFEEPFIESALVLASFFVDSDFDLEVETESIISFASEQEQTITAIDFSIAGLQGRSIPIKPHFESLRTRAEFEGGDNEMEIEFEVEA